MKSTPLLNIEIDLFYSMGLEESRLKTGLGPLEYERNQELISRYILKQQAVIVDVGGGPGIYSEWLANLGHIVYLVDPVLKHITQAKKRSARLKNPFHCTLGEAQQLDIRNDFADVVILHGPLYHLPLKENRANAIREAKRILKKGGIILGFGINFTAFTLVGLLNGCIHDPDFFNMCKEELTTGFHQPPANWPGLLPVAYFHKQEEFQKEFEAEGLSCLALLPVEGFIWLDKTYFESRTNPRRNKNMMELLQLMEKEKSLLAMSPHIMIAVQKE